MKKNFVAPLLLSSLMFSLTSCQENRGISITNGDEYSLYVGDTLQLLISYQNIEGFVEFSSADTSIVEVTDTGLVTAMDVGSTYVTAKLEDYTDTIAITVEENLPLVIEADKTDIDVGEKITIDINQEAELKILSGEDVISIEDNVVTGLKTGLASIYAQKGEIKSNILNITVIDSSLVIEGIDFSADKYYLNIGEETTLNAVVYPSILNDFVSYEIISGEEYIEITNNTLKGIKESGEEDIQVVAKVRDYVSDPISFSVYEPGETPEKVNLFLDKTYIYSKYKTKIEFKSYPETAAKNISYEVIEGEELVKIVKDEIIPLNSGKVTIRGSISGVMSNEVTIDILFDSDDPYIDVDKEEFYADYHEATSYIDAIYRSRHNLMSGDISLQDQEPSISTYQPKDGDKFIRNTAYRYLDSGNTYLIVDAYGTPVDLIYKGGAYTSLEDVAAYLYAFGDIPANQIEEKNARPQNSEWGEYLRLNFSYFSGDTDRYPYEPELPDISGINGNTDYYELDIGTTGTDCDPSYEAVIYNDGNKITRGAARIVASIYRYGEKITDPNEMHVFYTYNHYNDFQEYLNYRGGWGEMFGNITGGGTISSKEDYNPTPYVETSYSDFF